MIFLLYSLRLAFPLCTILAVCSCCCPPDSPLFFSFSLCPPQVCFLGEVHGSTVPRGKTPRQQVKNHPLVWHPLWPPPVAQWLQRAPRARRIQRRTRPPPPALHLKSPHPAGTPGSASNRRRQPSRPTRGRRRWPLELVEAEEEGRRTVGRTGAGGRRRIKGKEKTRAAGKSPAPKQKGRSKFLVDQSERANQERDPERDLERGGTGRDRPPRPQPPQLPPLLWRSRWWPQLDQKAQIYLHPSPRRLHQRKPHRHQSHQIYTSPPPHLHHHRHLPLRPRPLPHLPLHPLPNHPHLNPCSNPNRPPQPLLHPHLPPLPHLHPTPKPQPTHLHHRQSLPIPHLKRLDQEDRPRLLAQTTPPTPRHHLTGSRWRKRSWTALGIILQYR